MQKSRKPVLGKARKNLKKNKCEIQANSSKIISKGTPEETWKEILG